MRKIYAFVDNLLIQSNNRQISICLKYCHMKNVLLINGSYNQIKLSPGGDIFNKLS